MFGIKLDAASVEAFIAAGRIVLVRVESPFLRPAHPSIAAYFTRDGDDFHHGHVSLSELPHPGWLRSLVPLEKSFQSLFGGYGLFVEGQFVAYHPGYAPLAESLAGFVSYITSALGSVEYARQRDADSVIAAFDEEVTRRRLAWRTELEERAVDARPYEVLGIVPSSSLHEVVTAWKSARFRSHPDRIPERDEAGRRDATERSKKINLAYDAIRRERRGSKAGS